MFNFFKRKSKGIVRRRRAEELEFLPPALEILETPASPIPWSTAWILCFIGLSAIVWAWFGKVDIVATAPGRFIPSGKSKPIQSFAPAKVLSLHVRDGQGVKAGDVLVAMDTSEAAAELRRMSDEKVSLVSDIQRLEAALDEDIERVGSVLGAIRAEKILPEHRSLLKSQIDLHAAKLARLTAQHAEIEANVAGSLEQIRRINEIIPLITQRMESVAFLVARELMPKHMLLEVREKLISNQSDLVLQRNRIEQLKEQRKQIDAQRNELIAEYRRSALAELNNLRSSLRGVNQAITIAEKKIDDGRLRAPVDGVVYQLAANAAGAVFQPAQVIMVIVPENETLEIEAALDSKDVGFVDEGQQAEIKVDAFPFTRHGMLKAQVVTVSADSAAAPRQQFNDGNQTQEEARRQSYTVRLKLLDSENIVPQSTMQALKPGMTVAAEIKTGQRRLIEYVFSPLRGKLSEAARER